MEPWCGRVSTRNLKSGKFCEDEKDAPMFFFLIWCYLKIWGTRTRTEASFETSIGSCARVSGKDFRLLHWLRRSGNTRAFKGLVLLLVVVLRGDLNMSSTLVKPAMGLPMPSDRSGRWIELNEWWSKFMKCYTCISKDTKTKSIVPGLPLIRLHKIKASLGTSSMPVLKLSTMLMKITT